MASEWVRGMSWPDSALVVGVNRGEGSLSNSLSPSGSLWPKAVPVFL